MKGNVLPFCEKEITGVIRIIKMIRFPGRSMRKRIELFLTDLNPAYCNDNYNFFIKFAARLT